MGVGAGARFGRERGYPIETSAMVEITVLPRFEQLACVPSRAAFLVSPHPPWLVSLIYPLFLLCLRASDRSLGGEEANLD